MSSSGSARGAAPLLPAAVAVAWLLVLTGWAGARPPVEADAAVPRVKALVVGRTGWSVGPRTVTVGPVRVNRCRLRAGLPIGVLGALAQPFRARGGCSSLYVYEVRGERAAGAGGWVYKVGRRLPNRSASHPAGRLRAGQEVIWFWCRRAGRCGRTLDTTARSSNGRMRVVITGYDDNGRGRRVAGATVIVRQLGTRRRRLFRTGRDGTVLIRITRGRRYRVDSRRRGTIRGFPTEVRGR